MREREIERIRTLLTINIQLICATWWAACLQGLVRCREAIARAESEIARLRDQMANRSLSAIEAELLRQELKALRDQNLREPTFEERADLVAKLGIKILPSEDLKSRKIFCRLNLTEINEEREQAGFAKVFFGGAGGTRTPDLLRAREALSQLSYSPIYQNIIANKGSY